MDDKNFINSIVLIVSIDASGPLGFVINKPFHRPLNELTEFITMPYFPLFIGGPVDQEHLYMIYAKNELIQGGDYIDGDLYYGGNFQNAVNGIRNGSITTKNTKLFLGYCGWDANELENEIAEGSWEKCNDESLSIFQ